MINLPSRPDFPEVLDSTIIGAYKSCPQKALKEYFYHLKSAKESIHLVAGGAFAKGLEIYREEVYGKNTPTFTAHKHGAVALIREWHKSEPEDDWDGDAKSLWNMLSALEDTIREYPPATDPVKPATINGKLGVEFTFAIPLPGTKHPVTGHEILYAGRFDMLAEFNGMLMVEDDKTTGSLGAYWLKNWMLRSQITGYCWAAKSFGIPVGGALIRGIGIQKTQFKHMMAIEYRPQWQIDRWLHETIKIVNQMIEDWKANDFSYDLDSACTLYGGCPFISLCTKKNWQEWIEPDFVVRKWSPLEVHKIKENEPHMKELFS